MINTFDNTLPALLTRQEVATLLRITDVMVDKLARTGKLPSFKIGSNRRFHRADVLAMIPPARSFVRA
jgi:excisionase family DNA binding protein